MRFVSVLKLSPVRYNYPGVLLNIQRRLQHLQNINFDTQIDDIGQLGPAWWSQMHLFVAILEMAAILDFRFNNLTEYI